MTLLDSFRRVLGFGRDSHIEGQLATEGAGAAVGSNTGGGTAVADTPDAAQNRRFGTDRAAYSANGAGAHADEPDQPDFDDDLDPALTEDDLTVNGAQTNRPGLAASEPADDLPPIRNKQELLSELRRNYSEVVGLVRKVDNHLDQQSHRSSRMLQLAEDANTKMDALPRLADSTDRIADSVAQLTELIRDNGARSDETAQRISQTATNQLECLQQQTAALSQMQATIHRSSEADAELAERIKGFNTSMDSMARSTDDLGTAIKTMRETDAERERELSELLVRSQKWLVVGVGVFGMLALGTLVAVLSGAI